jgi:hypothetical protein
MGETHTIHTRFFEIYQQLFFWLYSALLILVLVNITVILIPRACCYLVIPSSFSKCYVFKNNPNAVVSILCDTFSKIQVHTTPNLVDATNAEMAKISNCNG